MLSKNSTLVLAELPHFAFKMSSLVVLLSFSKVSVKAVRESLHKHLCASVSARAFPHEHLYISARASLSPSQTTAAVSCVLTRKLSVLRPGMPAVHPTVPSTVATSMGQAGRWGPWSCC